MLNLKRVVVVMLSGSLAALLLAVNASAAVTTNIDIPLAGAVSNPCNGETVFFTGIDHFTASVTLDNAGGFHMAFHDNIHVTAAGDQGNSYVGNQEDNATINGRLGLVQTEPFTFTEISKGSAPNFQEHALFHITVNANGTVTVLIDNFTASCRG